MLILPALRELTLMRGLEIHLSWSELQDVPEEMVDVWEAVMAGEAHTQRAMAAEGKR